MTRTSTRRLRTVGIVAAASLVVAGAGATAATASPNSGTSKGYSKWAKAHGLKGKQAHKRADVDKDGLRNLAEYRLRLDPRKADTDGDGINDAMEDHDGDGLVNGLEDRLGSRVRGHDDSIHSRMGEDVEVKGVIASVSPTQIVLTVGPAKVTLDLPAGTVLQGDVTTGHLVEVKLVKTPSGWVLVSHTEDAPGDDDSPSGTTTGTTTTTSSTDDSPHGPDDSGHRGGRGR